MGISLLVTFLLLVFHFEVSLLVTAEQSRPSQANGTGTGSITTNKRLRNIVAVGSSAIVPNITVHGAVIVSDSGRVADNPDQKEVERALAAIAARNRNVQQLKDNLPFQLTEWAAVFVHPCPLFPYGHKTERGLMWAHYRIIREFAHFDPVLLAKYYALKKQGGLRAPLRSKDGIYQISIDGMLYKNDQQFRDNDIITIFEDDVESTINSMNTTVIDEFKQMNVDVLYLGWCDGYFSKPVPLCAHAYALTRRGAKKFARLYEPCGRALDEQLVIMVKNNFMTFRKAYQHNYANLNEKYRTTYGLKTCGMFHQNKALGSINGH
jgi:hypothetical protein